MCSGSPTTQLPSVSCYASPRYRCNDSRRLPGPIRGSFRRSSVCRFHYSYPRYFSMDTTDEEPDASADGKYSQQKVARVSLFRVVARSGRTRSRPLDNQRSRKGPTLFDATGRGLTGYVGSAFGSPPHARCRCRSGLPRRRPVCRGAASRGPAPASGRLSSARSTPGGTASHTSQPAPR